MEKHATSAELKAHAKGQLLGKYSTLVPAVLLVEAVMFTLSGLVSFPVSGTGFGGLAVQFAVECVLQLFAGIFIMGQTYMYLNVSCGGNIRIQDVFYGFTHHPDRAILLQLIQLLLTLAVFLPCFLFLGLWMLTDNLYFILPTALTFCFGLIAGTVIYLMYSQCFFVSLDFPEFTAVSCLKYSRLIMKGNKARRFYLDVSFIPLYILGFLSCGIGLLFVSPYVNATCSNFYLELMKQRSSQGE